MQVLHDSTLGDFTRGGQTFIHFLRMISQVIRKFFGAILLLYAGSTLASFWTMSDPYDRYLGFRYVGANLGQLLGNGPNASSLRGVEGAYFPVTIDQIAGSAVARERTLILVHQWLLAMGISLALAAGLSVLTMVWLVRFGASSRAEETLRGEGVVEAEVLARLLLKNKLASAIQLANIPIVKGSEAQHILATGSPGTGKTTLLVDLMQQIRRRGERCICFSPSGDFIQWFARQDDVILNPFDERCPSWDLWQECRAPYEYQRIAQSLIPEEKGGDNKFFTHTGRQMFSAVAEKMGRAQGTDAPTMERFIDWILRAPELELAAWLQDTDAASIVSTKADKTTANIRATLSTYVESLKYIPARDETRNHFCIRDWVDCESDKRWVFLNARASQLPTARPLLSLWIEIFGQALMDLPADPSKRLWLIIDELPALHRVSSLVEYVAQGRKSGGCTVVGFQSFSQLITLYGKDAADALVSQFGTWVCLRQNDPTTAEMVSKKLGQIEVHETTQGLSFGAHEMRDGVSANTQRKMRVVVTPTEIMQLDNLEGYVRLAGDLPTGHFRMRYRSHPQVAPMFIPARVAPMAKQTPAPLFEFVEVEDPTRLGSVGEGGGSLTPAGSPAATGAAAQGGQIAGTGQTSNRLPSSASAEGQSSPRQGSVQDSDTSEAGVAIDPSEASASPSSPDHDRFSI